MVSNHHELKTIGISIGLASGDSSDHRRLLALRSILIENRDMQCIDRIAFGSLHSFP